LKKEKQGVSLLLSLSHKIQTIMRTQTSILIFIGIMLAQTVFAQNIQLPAPDRKGGVPLMKALNDRQTSREFSEKELSLQDLSDFCWAAWGFNRDDKRTAPSSQNKQEMDLYVVIAKGVYLYNAGTNQLTQIKKDDVRAACGKQEFVAKAPVNFIYVANLEKRDVKAGTEITAEHLIESKTNSGFMAQNVYLVAASKGINCVVRGWIDADECAKALNLKPMQKVILGQTLGYKK
jgi:SagB-type dehydrogenase family enzyme